ncbi:MAG: chemotaxis protein CheC [Armatimonadetes bacterium]|nr:chemotaxis protein CheC [Armatimonadota bacterium]
MEKLNVVQLDALKEVGNIGTGHAATALSQLLGHRKVEVKIPEVTTATLDQLNWDPTGDSVMLFLLLKIYGEATGTLIITFPREAAFKLADMLTSRDLGTTKVLGPLEESALKELGNILAGCYLNSLSQFSGLLLIPSVPEVALDAPGAIRHYLGEVHQSHDLTFSIGTELSIESLNAAGKIYLLPDSFSIGRVLEKLGLGK